MADDDNGKKPAQDPAAAARRASSGTTSHGASEWTVSDRRGPLNAAGEDDDVERMVPSSEVDAVGLSDTAAAARSEGTAASTVAAEREDNDVQDNDAQHANDALHASDAQRAEASVSPLATDASHTAGTTAASHETVDADAAHGTPGVSTTPRRSVVPIAAAIVVGALVGAGSAAAVYTFYPGASGAAGAQDGGALESRVAALERRPDPQAAIADLKSRVDALDGKVKSLAQASPAPGAAPGAPATSGAPANAASDAALQSKMDDLQKALSTLDQRTADLQTKTGDLASQMTATKDQVSANKDVEGKIGALSAALADLRKQSAGTQSGLDNVQSEQKALAGRVGAPAMAVVADSLVQAIDAGRPFATQTDAAASLGADPARIAVLRENAAKGVPSSKALAAAFEPLVDPIVASEHRAPDNAGFFARLKAGAMSLVSIRRADSTTGTDVRSRVALIQSDLQHDDAPGALAVWSALPAEAKARSDAWGARLKTSVEALDAARALQHDAIAALAAKRS